MMGDDDDFMRDLEYEIRLLVKQSVNSAEVMKLKSAFFDIMPVEPSIERSLPEIERKLHNKPHKPKDVADFMKLFDNPSGLKYLTHDFDEADQIFKVTTFLLQAKEAFFSSARIYTIPASLFETINQFAFQPNPKWFAEKTILEGWSSIKWIKWSEAYGHPSRNPEFDKFIQMFRQLTRIKSSLYNLIESSIDKKFKDRKDQFNFIIDERELAKADFYTHVGWFSEALGHLFDEIFQRPSHPDVVIQYDRQAIGDYRHRIIHICQYDSYPSKPLKEVLEKYKQQGGNLWSVRKNLFGYCDWYIETIWDEHPVRLHFLKEGMKHDEVEIEVETLDSLNRLGFTHTLTFYHRPGPL